MTYPQQGGYGPQQGGYGPPQQGGYGPPQQGGYGPPQQGGYGPPQQGGYGPPQQPGGYGQYPPGYPPPQKNNNGLIIGIVSGVVVLAVVALVLVLALNGDDSKSADGGTGTSQEGGVPGGSGSDSGGSGPDSGDSGGGDSGGGDSGGGDSGGGVSSAEALADKVVEVIETQDEDLVDEYACSASDAAGLKSELSRLDGMQASATVDDVQESGDTAQARIVVEFQGQEERFTVEMEKKDSGWCVSGI